MIHDTKGGKGVEYEGGKAARKSVGAFLSSCPVCKWRGGGLLSRL